MGGGDASPSLGLGYYQFGRRPSKDSSSQRDFDQSLDTLIQQTSARVDKLSEKSAQLKEDLSDAERRLQQAKQALAAAVASPVVPTSKSNLERQRALVEQEKKEQRLQEDVESAQSTITKTTTQLNNELIELRDYRLLLLEYKKVKLEKLQSDLARARDGTVLRAILREMIRQGGKELPSRIAQAGLPLEPWMREALVNMCHIEVEIDSMEAVLLQRRQAVVSLAKDDIEGMRSRTKQARFEQLCSQTQHVVQDIRENKPTQKPPTRQQTQSHLGDTLKRPSTREQAQKSAVQAVRTTEAQVSTLRKLLSDTRGNIANSVGNRMDQAHRMEKQDAKEVDEWGKAVMHLMISEEFANATMKQRKAMVYKEELTG